MFTKFCAKLASVYIKLVHGNQALNFFLKSYCVISVDKVVIHEMMIQ